MTDPSLDSDLEMQIALFHQPAIDHARKMIVRAGVAYPLIPIAIFGAFARITGPAIFWSTPFLVVFGVGLAIFGVHLAIAHWAKRSPFAATLTALIVFVAWMVGVAIYESPHLVISAVGLFILGRGVLASYRVRRLRKTAAVG